MIKLITNNGEQHRIDRLAKTIKLACFSLGITKPQADLLIVSCADDRGSLSVRWVTEPSSRQRESFADAWELVGESPARVSHSVGSVMERDE